MNGWMDEGVLSPGASESSGTELPALWGERRAHAAGPGRPCQAVRRRLSARGSPQPACLACLPGSTRRQHPPPALRRHQAWPCWRRRDRRWLAIWPHGRLSGQAPPTRPPPRCASSSSLLSGLAGAPCPLPDSWAHRGTLEPVASAPGPRAQHGCQVSGGV